jgi:hypothetical protein
MQVQQVAKTAADATAHGAVIATLLGWLPSIAAIFSIIWLTIQIIERVVGKPFHELLRCICSKTRCRVATWFKR